MAREFLTAQATGYGGVVVDMVGMRSHPARAADEPAPDEPVPDRLAPDKLVPDKLVPDKLVPTVAGDELELALLCARELIDRTMSEHRRRSSERRVAVAAPDDASLLETAERAVAEAFGDVGIVMAEDSTLAAAAWTAALRRPPADRPARAVRLLCTPAAVSSPAVAASGWRTRGFDVHVTPGPLRDAVIVDDRYVFVRSELEPAGRQLSVVREPVVAQTFTAMFQGVWRTASAPVEGMPVDDRAHSGLTWLVLQHLRDGSTDEAASRQVQVSLRTYRRRVAEIMRGLGADSRFQAGARAAEIGLVTASW